ncbi:MAG: hypothetical protein ACJ74N_01160 [Gaiellaceae bacterium]
MEIPPPLGSAGFRVASAPVSVTRPEIAPVSPLVDASVLNPVTAPGWPPEVVSVTKLVPVSAGAATPALDASVTKPVTAPGTPPDVLSVTMPATAAGAGVAPPSIDVCAYAAWAPAPAIAVATATVTIAALSLRPCASKSGSLSIRSSSSASNVQDTVSPFELCRSVSRSSRDQATLILRSLRSPFWILAISRNRSAPASS